MVRDIEAVDPIALSMKLVDPGCDCSCMPDSDLREVPEAISRMFNEELCLGPARRRLYVTLGQFSIIRLERDVQIVIPSYDNCIPDKECIGGTEDDPCTLFSRIPFPVEEFFPPSSCVETSDDCCD